MVVLDAANLPLVLVFLALLAIGTPIAVALGAGGVAGILVGLDMAALGTVGTNTWKSRRQVPADRRAALHPDRHGVRALGRGGTARHLRRGLHRPRRGGWWWSPSSVCLTVAACWARGRRMAPWRR
ncbi:MAG: hypothetical protein R3C69_11280 [Geminicoccaceae bacterium]